MERNFSEYLLEKGKWTKIVQFYSYKIKYVFGAGHQAELVLSMLNSYFESDVNGIIVSEKNQINIEAAHSYRLPIYQVDEVVDKEKCAVLLAVSCKSNESIAHTLSATGYKNIIYVDDWQLANEEILFEYQRYLALCKKDLHDRKVAFEMSETENLQIETSYSDCIITSKKVNSLDENQCYEILNKVRKSSKQIFVYYGNCQFNAIRYYLIQNEWFRKNFFVFDIPKIYETHQLCKKKGFLHELWKETDIFLYQEVADINNKFGNELKTDYITTQLQEKCKKIKICNSYFDGYFSPNIFEKESAERIYEYKIVGCHKFGGREDYIVYEYLKNNDISKTIANLLGDNYFSEEDVLNQVSSAFERLRSRELTCDIIISDYIEDHFKDEILFYCMNHPAESIVKELSRRILEKCGCPNDKIIVIGKLKRELDAWRQICYPSIMKKNGIICDLKGHGSKYWYNVDYTHFIYDMNLPEYIEKYIRHLNANHELDKMQLTDLKLLF